jgi:RHS repeat-associated protein
VLNVLGQRVKKSGTSITLFVYDESGHLLGEYDGSGNLIEETVWMGDVPVATLRPNGTGISVYYIHTDHLNTPRRISRPTDNVIVWRWDSEPFGTAAANQDPDGDGTQFVYNPRFPGQYFDAETGLNYNYFRDYDPAIGRYAESDPIGLHGGVNTYAYGKGSAVSNIDPYGLVSIADEWSYAQSIQPPPIRIVRGTPTGACACHTSSGTPFFVPPGANFSAVQAAGQSAGLNPFAVNSAIGHYGTYDFQRNAANNTFTGAYTDASNYAVGVYMQGAGYSLSQTIAIGQFFGHSMSSNAGDPRQQAFWEAGWNAANAGLSGGGCK